MFSIHRPAASAISDFLITQAAASLSYSPVGISAEAREGYNHDFLRQPVGRGEAAFAAARLAIATWRVFPRRWVEVFPRQAALVPGTTVAVLARHLGFWSLNACRVVERRDSSPSEFGFAYGTLVHHAESGEERFLVSLDPLDGTVWYEIRATSRPRAVLARLGYPVSRFLQDRFRRESAIALREAIEDGVEQRDAPDEALS